MLPRLSQSGLRVGEDFFLAFSPERVDPGNEVWRVRNTPKVIGGTTEPCQRAAAALYGEFIDTIVPVPSTDAAEMVKLLENTFRAVNIGLVNEIAIMCRRLGLGTWEVIDAAATKPFGFMPFYPGPGLGGHCIPVDPQYLSWKLKTLKYHARFIELAGEINSGMPQVVVQLVADALNDTRKALRGSRVLVIGVAYKRDIEDVRESPALDVLEFLHARGAEIAYHDPYVPELRLGPLALRSEPLDALASWDCVVVVTNHSNIDYRRILAEAPLVLDTRNATKGLRDGARARSSAATTVDRQAAGVPRPLAAAGRGVHGFGRGLRWLALRMVRPDMGALRAAIGALDLRVRALLAIVYVAQAVRTLRWAALLRPLGTVRCGSCPSAVGYRRFTVPTLGGRTSVSSAAWRVARKRRSTSVVVERILDRLLVALLTFVALLPLSLAVRRRGGFLRRRVRIARAVPRRRGRARRPALEARGGGRGARAVLAPLSHSAAPLRRCTPSWTGSALPTGASRSGLADAGLDAQRVWPVLAAAGIDLDLRATWATIGIIVYSFLVPALNGGASLVLPARPGLFFRPVLRGAGVALAVTMHATQVASGWPASSLFSPRCAGRATPPAPRALGASATLVACAARAGRGVGEDRPALRRAVDTLWSVALRFIRVDRGYGVRDKDRRPATCSSTGRRATSTRLLGIFVSGPEG